MLLEGEKSLNIIKQRFLANGYPKNFIEKHKFVEKNVSVVEAKKTFDHYIKIPYNSEAQKHCIQRLIVRTGLSETIRPIYIAERPLSRLFRQPFKYPSCHPNCITCSTAEKPNCCFTKFFVYMIVKKVYIGQSKRTARSRIKEDLCNAIKHPFLHSQYHNISSRDLFTWKIVQKIQDLNTRLSIESLHININAGNLINGCTGKEMLPYLKTINLLIYFFFSAFVHSLI